MERRFRLSFFKENISPFGKFIYGNPDHVLGMAKGRGCAARGEGGKNIHDLWEDSNANLTGSSLYLSNFQFPGRCFLTKGQFLHFSSAKGSCSHPSPHPWSPKHK